MKGLRQYRDCAAKHSHSGAEFGEALIRNIVGRGDTLIKEINSPGGIYFFALMTSIS